jgi:hypothetical protein
LSDADNELIEQLRQIAAEADRVPEAVRGAASRALAFRRPDADLAELAFDSWSAPGELVGMRRRTGPGRLRQLTFVTRAMRLELEIDPRHRALVGVVTPAPAAGAELRHVDGATPFTVDEHGRFSLSALPDGPASIAISLPDGGVVTTEWLSL